MYRISKFVLLGVMGWFLGFPGSVFAQTVNKVYWTDSHLGNLIRSDADGGNVETLIGDDFGYAEQVVVDYQNDKIYFTDPWLPRILRADLDGTNVETLISSGLEYPTAIDVDPVGGKIYFVDDSASNIQRANLDGSGVEEIIGGIGYPLDLEVDAGGGKVYWLDATAPAVRRADLDGSNDETIVSTGLIWPASLALDLVNGKVYWIDEDTNDRIMRADLDGSNVETVLTIDMTWPAGLELDVPNGKMYWVDTYGETLSRANLDGTGVEVIVSEAFITPVSISIDPDSGKVYWCETSVESIRRANLDGSQIEDLYATLPKYPGNLVIDPLRGKVLWSDDFTEKLQQSNLDGSAIEDLVVGAWFTGIALDLPGGMMYFNDNTANAVKRSLLDGSNVTSLVTTGLSGPAAMAVDLQLGKIYWSDVGTKKIQRSNLDGSNVEDLVTSGLSSPRDMAIDFISGKLYWSDYPNNSISRSDLDGGNVEVVLGGLGRPRGIGLDVAGGKIYWAEENTKKLRRANLDGTAIEDLHSYTGGELDGLELYLVDSTAPAAPVISAPADSSATNNLTPTISGTAEPATRIAIFSDAALLGTTVSDGSGNWSLSAGSALSTGGHTFSATSLDAAGNLSAVSAGVSVTFDTSAPGAPIIGAPTDGAVTGDTTPTVSGSAEANATVEVLSGATSLGSTTADGAGQWSFTPSSVLNDGVHTLSARATDAAGNTSGASAAVDLTVDSQAPPAPAIGSPAGGTVTGDATPTISGSAEANSTVEVFSGLTPLGTSAADGSGAWTFTSASAMSDGKHQLRAQATDAAGNTGAQSTAVDLTIDTQAPSAAVISSPALGTVTGDRTPTLSGSAEAHAIVAVFSGGSSLGTTAANSAGGWSFTPGSDLADGVHAFTAQATDSAGNTGGASAPLTVTIDSLPPEMPTILSPAGGTVTNDGTPTFAGKAEASATVEILRGGTALGTATANGSGAWTFTPTGALSDGVHSLAAKAIDAAGNSSAVSAALSITIDTTAPAVPSIERPAAGEVLAEVRPFVYGQAEANSTVTVFDGDTVLGETSADAEGRWSIQPAADLSEGFHVLRVQARDAGDNIGALSAAVTFRVNEEALSSPAYMPWNGYLDIANILELVNLTEAELTVRIEVFDSAGTVRGDYFLAIDARGQRDVILNELSGFASDSYGIVRLSWDAPGALDGRLTYYRNAELPDEFGNFDFAFSIPLQRASRGDSYVSFNSANPSMDPEDAGEPVPNWLSIVNLDGQEAKSFTVLRYGVDGAIIDSMRYEVPALGRRDISAGHEFGSGFIGVSEIVPDDPTADYQAMLVRYGADSSFGQPSTRYNFAIPLLASAAITTERWLPISNGAGGQNWLEVVNTEAEAVVVDIRAVENSGAQIYSRSISIPPHAQVHLQMSRLLSPGASGRASIRPSAGGGFVAQSMFYFNGSNGKVQSAYGSQTVRARNGVQFGSWNLYLGMYNFLRLFNTSDSGQQVALTVYNNGSKMEKSIFLQAKSGVDFGLHEGEHFGTDQDAYGLLVIEGQGLTADVLRFRPHGEAIDFIFPLSVRP